MDQSNATSLFSKQDCDRWIRAKENNCGPCCHNAKLITYLKQDRAIDEPPSVYEKCLACGQSKKLTNKSKLSLEKS